MKLLLLKSQPIFTKERRPSNDIEIALIKKSRKPNASRPPNKDIRLDRIDHWPVDSQKRGRCKMPGCNGYTWQECKKYKTSLCVGKEKICFKKYHTTYFYFMHTFLLMYIFICYLYRNL